MTNFQILMDQEIVLVFLEEPNLIDQFNFEGEDVPIYQFTFANQDLRYLF